MNRDFNDMRVQYGDESIDVNTVDSNPFIEFDKWFNLAKESSGKEVNAMILSTSDENNHPDARVVLLKEIADGGFVFYTNFTSAKGNQLEVNNKAALTFAWIDLEKQVRIKGTIEKYDNTKAEKYFQSRPKMSQIAAWASPQSKVVKDRETLIEIYHEYEKLYADKAVLPKPPLWGGYILYPTSIEFWQGRANRLHDRVRYIKTDEGWIIERLAP
jgi:pyridoxamine 5'-phosphate oxidase